MRKEKTNKQTKKHNPENTLDQLGACFMGDVFYMLPIGQKTRYNIDNLIKHSLLVSNYCANFVKKKS